MGKQSRGGLVSGTSTWSWALLFTSVVLLGATFYRVKRAQEPPFSPSAARAAWLNAFPGSELKTLENATRFELLSLNPLPDDYKGGPYFHSYEVLGRVVAAPALKQQLLQALAESTRTLKPGETTAACFFPRHGIRASRGTQRVEALLCFECGAMRTYGSAGQVATVLLRHRAETFDNALRAAHVKRAES